MRLSINTIENNRYSYYVIEWIILFTFHFFDMKEIHNELFDSDVFLMNKLVHRSHYQFWKQLTFDTSK